MGKTWHMFAHQLPNREGSRTWFAHIMGTEFQTKLCGSEPVVAITCEEAEDGTYYGWESFDPKRGGCNLSMVYPSYALHSMCFTYGPEVEEKAGKGRTIRLRVTLLR